MVFNLFSGGGDLAVSVLLTGKNALSPIFDEVGRDLKKFEKDLGKGIDSLDKSLRKSTESFEKMGLIGKLSVAGAVGAIGSAFKYSMEQAFEQERVNKRLQVSYGELSSTITSVSRNMTRDTAFTGGEIQQAFVSAKGTMDLLGLSAKDTQDIIQIAMDVSVAKGVEFNAVLSDLLSGLRGNTRAVAQYGIAVDSLKEGVGTATGNLQSIKTATTEFAGAAEEGVTEVDKLKKNLADLAETVGTPLAYGFNILSEGVRNAIASMEAWNDFLVQELNRTLGETNGLIARMAYNALTLDFGGVIGNIREGLGKSATEQALPTTTGVGGTATAEVESKRQVTTASAELIQKYIVEKETLNILKNSVDVNSKSFGSQLKVINQHQATLDELSLALGGSESETFKLANTMHLTKDQVAALEASLANLLKSIGGKPGKDVLTRTGQLFTAQGILRDPVTGRLYSETQGGVRSVKTNKVSQDFISRPGMPNQNFSPSDTIIGVKDPSKLGGGGVNITINAGNADSYKVAEMLANMLKVRFNYA